MSTHFSPIRCFETILAPRWLAQKGCPLIQHQAQQTMKFSSTFALSMLVGSASAFSPASPIQKAINRASFSSVAVEMGEKPVFDQEQFIQESKDMRLKHLEEQAMYALKISAENYGNAVFPNAMIAGDLVITDLLGRMGYLKDGKVKVMVVDTFHLFPETMEFLKKIEDHYGFKAEVFCAEGIPVGDKDAFDKRYGADLWKEDIDEYDRVCKVEPFQRGLKTLGTDCMINGRTRWQGFERAWIDLFENAPIGGGLAKCNPIAYWTLEDTFDYFAKHKVPYHPLHEKGYPSIGDAKDTIPIPEDGSVKFVNYEWEGDKTQWLDYATERKGRFVGLANKDGSTKTECGIHVEGAERTWDRDLWEADKSSVKKVDSSDAALEVVKSGKPAVMVVYAPWCQFSQNMEEEFESFAGATDLDVFSYRGDEDREFVQANLNTQSFPTVNVIKPDGTVVKYESEERTVDAFKKFVEETL
ncbi:Phosphoadenosine phosphosulfate reductase [Seminavis robusta]|uniref:Phosphoadenosine phosphosulfate reductase n=1 Tax=Seminavis robusta TaxID=568900 RepID=A0A9N8HKY6_9STRA|nr:Phosphoadenosine phosphosulfate reductase [Seminavis robusta]|eukprot:Sro646_g180760.1 Phosphoadenosine phosphosulfate reductase (471) ;mRNA; f:31872-33762